MLAKNAVTQLKVDRTALGGIVIGAAILANGCATPPANPIQAKTPTELCAASNYDPNVIVFRDESSQYRVAAVGVTGGGNLTDFAAIVGPSVITSRGGALATGGSKTDVEAWSCDRFDPSP